VKEINYFNMDSFFLYVSDLFYHSDARLRVVMITFTLIPNTLEINISSHEVFTIQPVALPDKLFNFR